MAHVRLGHRPKRQFMFFLLGLGNESIVSIYMQLKSIELREHNKTLLLRKHDFKPYR